MATVRKRERGKNVLWQVRWRQRQADGSVKEVSESFKTEKAARSFSGLVDANGQSYPPNWHPGLGLVQDPATAPAPTLAEYYGRWLETRHTTARTLDDYKRNFRQHVPDTLAKKHLDKITTEDVGLWLAALRKKGLAAKTIANIQGAVSASVKMAVVDGVLGVNPFAGQLKDRGTKRRRLQRKDVLECEEFELIRSFIPEHYKSITTFLYGTGLRWSEATALQVQDLDLKRGIVYVSRAWQRQPKVETSPEVEEEVSTTWFELDDPKTDASIREVHINAGLIELLRRQCQGKSYDAFVFTNTRGDWITPSAYYHGAWEPARDKAKAAGLTKRVRIHDLRHGHVAYLISKGVSLEVIKERLGHTSIVVTYDTYGGLIKGSEQKVLAALDDLDMGLDAA